jgi:5,6-dimethylbenzimidazole synthase
MTGIEDFLALVRARRSIRRFRPDPLPPDAIRQMLEAARWAMSGANAQPWEFVVVQDAATRRRIVAARAEARREIYDIEQTRLPGLRHPQFRRPEADSSFKDAPVLIAVLGDRRTYQATVLAANFLRGEGGSEATFLKNMGNATQNLHLAAAALGLGSQWISVSYVWGQEIKKILGVPEMLELHTLAAVGYPFDTPGPSSRRPLAEMTHYERYDLEKYRTGEQVVRYVLGLREQAEGVYRQGSGEDD